MISYSTRIIFTLKNRVDAFWDRVGQRQSTSLQPFAELIFVVVRKANETRARFCRIGFTADSGEGAKSNGSDLNRPRTVQLCEELL